MKDKKFLFLQQLESENKYIHSPRCLIRPTKLPASHCRSIISSTSKTRCVPIPSGTIVGVNSNASDTAALLAASSDLSVQPSYVRSVAEAHTAALAAKQQEIKAWERGQEDPDASAAASNAKRTTLSSTTLPLLSMLVFLQ